MMSCLGQSVAGQSYSSLLPYFPTPRLPHSPTPSTPLLLSFPPSLPSYSCQSPTPLLSLLLFSPTSPRPHPSTPPPPYPETMSDNPPEADDQTDNKRSNGSRIKSKWARPQLCRSVSPNPTLFQILPRPILPPLRHRSRYSLPLSHTLPRSSLYPVPVPVGKEDYFEKLRQDKERVESMIPMLPPPLQKYLNGDSFHEVR